MLGAIKYEFLTFINLEINPNEVMISENNPMLFNDYPMEINSKQNEISLINFYSKILI